MKKLFFIFILLTLGIALSSCAKDEQPIEEPVLAPSSSLIEDLSNLIKGVFSDSN